MSVIQINGTVRENVGKGVARKARAAGQIPGVLYGHGETPMAVQVDSRHFLTAMRAHKGGNAIINLNLGSGEYTALVRDVQYDPVSRAVLHLDFQHISLTEKVTVEVPIHLIGIAIGVKDFGGILEHNVRALEVRCLPTQIPGSLDADVTALNIGDTLHVRDLKAEGVEILAEADMTIATIVAPTVEEVAAVAATVEPEVVAAKGKKEEAVGEEAKKK